MKSMPRWTILLGILLLAWGCRRVGPPQEKVSVAKESDYLIGMSEEELLEKLKPKVEKKIPPEETAEQKKAREDEETRQQKAKEKEEKDLLSKNIARLGVEHRSFRKSNPVKAHSLDNFKKYLRRAPLPELRKMVDEKKVEVLMDVDPDAPNHVLVYASETSGEAGHEAALSGGGKGFIKAEDLKNRLQTQELRVAYLHYKVYVANTLKEHRSLADLKNWLKENSSPTFQKLVDSGEMLMADPSESAKWVACKGNTEVEGKGYAAVSATGSPGFIPLKTVQATFRKKE